MTHARALVECEDCRPDGYFEACGTMDQIVRGEVDPEDWLCQDHIEEMNEATREWAAQREKSS